MKTVFIVTGSYNGEDEFISGVFEDGDKATLYAQEMAETDIHEYQYFVDEWELK